jgi:hypothetical protein
MVSANAVLRTRRQILGDGRKQPALSNSPRMKKGTAIFGSLFP